MRTVDSKVYTKAYYLTDCTHYQEFVRSNGLELGDRFVKLLPYMDIHPGMRVLDVGSGRGEMCMYAALKGASVLGVDYSAAAIEIANKAKTGLTPAAQRRLQYVKAPVTAMDLPKDSFDLVICIEVLEHLYPEEIEVMLSKIYASLKLGGTAIFHTAPNRWFNDYGYRYWSFPVGNLLIKMSNGLSRGSYPPMQNFQELRTDSHRVMHVNEPTFSSLYADFHRHSWLFSIQSLNITMIKPVLSWKDRLFNLLVYFHPLSRRFPFNMIFGDDFLVQVIKRGG